MSHEFGVPQVPSFFRSQQILRHTTFTVIRYKAKQMSVILCGLKNCARNGRKLQPTDSHIAISVVNHVTRWPTVRSHHVTRLLGRRVSRENRSSCARVAAAAPFTPQTALACRGSEAEV